MCRNKVKQKELLHFLVRQPHIYRFFIDYASITLCGAYSELRFTNFGKAIKNVITAHINANIQPIGQTVYKNVRLGNSGNIA